ncbi:hypothetical protein LY76DRAFT_119777 [Colletotrichum caudatum]|nr:hypothetical protein LY76DRAFT_119777 [Colletotrichum caudatum]
MHKGVYPSALTPALPPGNLLLDSGKHPPDSQYEFQGMGYPQNSSLSDFSGSLPHDSREKTRLDALSSAGSSCIVLPCGPGNRPVTQHRPRGPSPHHLSLFAHQTNLAFSPVPNLLLVRTPFYVRTTSLPLFYVIARLRSFLRLPSPLLIFCDQKRDLHSTKPTASHDPFRL